jgi:Polysaccharide pyruvyl transferase
MMKKGQRQQQQQHESTTATATSNNNSSMMLRRSLSSSLPQRGNRNRPLMMVPFCLLMLVLVLQSWYVITTSLSALSSFHSFLENEDGEEEAGQQDSSGRGRSSSSSSSQDEQVNPRTIGVSSSSASLSSSSSPSSPLSSSSFFWNLSNPIWPWEPPALRPDCKVVFRQNNNHDDHHDQQQHFPQQLCHIVPWGANFGDEIGPPIVKRILELYFHCSAQELRTMNLAPLGDRHMNRSSAVVVQPDGITTVEGDPGPCLLSVGSLWRMAQTHDHVWGTGVAFDGTVEHRCRRDRKYRIANLTIYSSRGPNSVAHIHQYCPFASIINNNNTSSTNTDDDDDNDNDDSKRIPSAGDAGFLIPYLFPEHVPHDSWPIRQRRRQQDLTDATTSTNSTSRRRLCIIPHHNERNNPQFRRAEQPPYNALRLTVQQSWQDMVTSMLTQCDAILSSSLHGIIFAETLGIASKRLRLTQQPGDFKFDDFYASYRGGGAGVSSSSTTVTSMDHLYARGNVTEVIENNDDSAWIQPLSVPQRDAYARRILETFPIHLFETVPLSSSV